MPVGLLDRIAATLALQHARRQFGRFERALRDARPAQQTALQRALQQVRGSAFAQAHRLDRVRTLDDLRAALPLHRYEDLRPWIDRVVVGETGALFAPGTRLHMFATSSGTTAAPKRIPVTSAFVEDYRRGWNTFGAKMLSDHPEALLRAILQSSGRHDAEHTSTGVPVGAITGLLARTQKRIVRRYYVGRPEIALLSDALARYYVLMRLGLARDVAFAITANPATLIGMARCADEHAEALIRDIHDGTLSAEQVPDPALRSTLLRGVRPQPARARVLEGLRATHGVLRPRDAWNLSFVACWTGGSMGQYLERLGDWYGPLPVRDVGLLASEGRVTIPTTFGTASGPLDVTAGCFEFIPVAEFDHETPRTLDFSQLDVGGDYAVVLTNPAGLFRYRLDDIVRCTGHVGGAPTLAFLYRGGRVSSLAGEKLTENQVVDAFRSACVEAGGGEFDYLLAPVWGDPPTYRLLCEQAPDERWIAAFDASLQRANEEYASRRKSFRLGSLEVVRVGSGRIRALDREMMTRRGATAEQYKRQTLLTRVGEDAALLAVSPAEA